MSYPENPFFPSKAQLDEVEMLIDAEHERRLRRESALEREGREMDNESPDWPDVDD